MTTLPEWVRVERGYSGGRVDVSYECPYCWSNEPAGHRDACPRRTANETASAH
jgi:hypothetical protein